MSLYSSIELRLNYQSNTGNHGARGRCRQCTASGVFVVFCAVLLFNLLFCAQRGGQGAEHVASPLPRGPCHIIARVLSSSHADVDHVHSCAPPCRARSRGVDDPREVGDLIDALRLPLPLCVGRGEQSSTKTHRRLAVDGRFLPARRVLRWMKDEA